MKASYGKNEALPHHQQNIEKFENISFPVHLAGSPKSFRHSRNITTRQQVLVDRVWNLVSSDNKYLICQALAICFEEGNFSNSNNNLKQFSPPSPLYSPDSNFRSPSQLNISSQLSPNSSLSPSEKNNFGQQYVESDSSSTSTSTGSKSSQLPPLLPKPNEIANVDYFLQTHNPNMDRVINLDKYYSDQLHFTKLAKSHNILNNKFGQLQEKCASLQMDNISLNTSLHKCRMELAQCRNLVESPSIQHQASYFANHDYNSMFVRLSLSAKNRSLPSTIFPLEVQEIIHQKIFTNFYKNFFSLQTLFSQIVKQEIPPIPGVILTQQLQTYWVNDEPIWTGFIKCHLDLDNFFAFSPPLDFDMIEPRQITAQSLLDLGLLASFEISGHESSLQCFGEKMQMVIGNILQDAPLQVEIFSYLRKYNFPHLPCRHKVFIFYAEDEVNDRRINLNPPTPDTLNFITDPQFYNYNATIKPDKPPTHYWHHKKLAAETQTIQIYMPPNYSMNLPHQGYSYMLKDKDIYLES